MSHARWRQPLQPLAGEQGQGIVMVLVGSICLLISLLALASSLSFVQAMNSSAERRSNAEDFVRSHLQALKGSVQSTGSLSNFVRGLQPDTTEYNPVITTNLNDPAVFLSTFAFPITSEEVIHNVKYTVTYHVTEYRFDASLNPVAMTLGTDQLRDLAFITFTVDLTPVNAAVLGIDGPTARHGEIYVAK